MSDPVPAAARQELREDVVQMIAEGFDGAVFDTGNAADLYLVVDAVLAAIEPLLAKEAELRDGIIKRLLDGWEPVLDDTDERVWYVIARPDGDEPMSPREIVYFAAPDRKEATDG